MMLIDFEPGDYGKIHKDWGIGQVQSIIGNKVTVNLRIMEKELLTLKI